MQLPRAVGASEPPGLGALLARNDEYLETAATDYRVPLVAPAPTAADGPVRDDTGRLSAAGAAAVAAEVAPRAAAELWPGAGEAAR